jgi:hypothetical protein
MQVSGHGPRRFSAIDARASSMAASSSGTGPASPGFKQHSRRRQSKIFDDPAITRGYESVPLIDIDTLPRGGISFDTKAVGRVQVRLLDQYNCCSIVRKNLAHLPACICIATL